MINKRINDSVSSTRVVPKEATREYHIPGAKSYTWMLSHQMWMLGITLKTSGRAIYAQNFQIISSSPLHGLLDLCRDLMLWGLLLLCHFASAGTKVQKLRWHVSGEQKEGWSTYALNFKILPQGKPYYHEQWYNQLYLSIWTYDLMNIARTGSPIMDKESKWASIYV